MEILYHCANRVVKPGSILTSAIPARIETIAKVNNPGLRVVPLLHLSGRIEKPIKEKRNCGYYKSVPLDMVRKDRSRNAGEPTRGPDVRCFFRNQAKKFMGIRK